MKVTKHGKRYEDGSPYKGTCNMCGCQVEVNRKEIKHGDGGRNEGPYYYVPCPECEYQIYFRDARLGNEHPIDYTIYDR